MNQEGTKVSARNACIAFCAVILLGAATWLCLTLFDEHKMNAVRINQSRSSVLATLGQPDLELSPIPDDPFYAARDCGTPKPATLLFYRKGNFRRSALVYLDNAGKVQCINRRGFMIVGNRN